MAIILCVYVGAGFWALRGELLRGLRHLPWGVIPVVLGLVFVGWGLRALRWHYYVHRLQWPVPLGHSILAFFASFGFSATPGKAGEVIKSVLLRARYNVPLAQGAGVLVVERLGDLLGVLILAIGGLALLTDGLVYFIAGASLVVGMTVLVSARSLYQPMLAQAARIPRLGGPVEKVLRLLETGRVLLRPGPLLPGVGLALLAWGCEGCALQVLLRAFGLSLHPLTACSIFAIATLVGALSFLPGGLGGFEVVMVLLLSRLGLAVTAAALPVLLFRCCTLWLGSLVGFLVLLAWLGFISPGAVRASSRAPNLQAL